MSATHQVQDTANDPQATTLGTLLYAAANQPPATESAWVGLVRSIGTGDQVAFRDLYGRMHVIVHTLIVRIVGNTETAEELTLDVFHDVWKRAASYDEAGGTVVGWIMNQARSRAIDQTRFERRKKRVDPFPCSAEPASDSDTGRQIDSEARDKQVRAAVANLAAPERNAIETAYFSDCSYAETASRLGEPAGTVKSRIRSGIEKLRNTLDGDA